jgi:hypothetical protein
MKSITALISAHLARGQHRGNLRVMFGLLGVLAVMVTLFSVLFHLLMAREGQEHSWLTGLYWTIVAMSTLGFGDITFTSDLGRMFSVVVVVTGTVFMLIILPFTFIQFFYAPWLEARDAARAPRELPEATTGPVLLTGFGPVDRALAQRLRQFRTPYVVLVGSRASRHSSGPVGRSAACGPSFSFGKTRAGCGWMSMWRRESSKTPLAL